MNRVREAARSNLVMSPIVAVAGVGATVAVVRSISPREFAVFAVVLAFKGTIQFASDFGTGAAATRVFAELGTRGAARQAATTFVRLLGIRGAMALAFTAFVVLFPGTFAQLLGLGEDDGVVALTAAIGVVETASSLGYSLLTGLLRHRWVNRIVLASTLIQPAAVIAAATAGLGLEGITAGLLLGSIVRSGGFVLAAVPALRAIEETGARATALTRTYSRTAAGSIAGKLATWVHSRQLVTLIAIQSANRVDVAVFALAYDFVQQVLVALTTPLGSLLLPVIASSVDDQAHARRMYQTAARLLASLVIPAAAVLLGIFVPLIDLLFGDAYSMARWFGLLFVPAVAAELVVSGPTTALMLSDDRMLPVFGRIKAMSVVFGGVYFLLAGSSLFLVAGVMVAIRLTGTVVLASVAHRRLRLRVDKSWVGGLLAASLLAGGLAALPAFVLDDLAALVFGGLLAATTLVLLTRRWHLLSAADAQLARELVPSLGHLVDLLCKSAPVPVRRSVP